MNTVYVPFAKLSGDKRSPSVKLHNFFRFVQYSAASLILRFEILRRQTEFRQIPAGFVVDVGQSEQHVLRFEHCYFFTAREHSRKFINRL